MTDLKQYTLTIKKNYSDADDKEFDRVTVKCEQGDSVNLRPLLVLAGYEKCPECQHYYASNLLGLDGICFGCLP